MEGRELLERFRKSGTPWTAVDTSVLRALIRGWFLSGQRVTREIALADLMCRIDSGDPPSLRTCMQRWGWGQNPTREFLEELGLLKRRSPSEVKRQKKPASDPVPVVEQTASAEPAKPARNEPEPVPQESESENPTQQLHSDYTAATHETAESNENRGLPTQDLHRTYTAATQPGDPDYIKDQRRDSPIGESIPPNPPEGGELGQSAELARVLSAIGELDNQLETGEVLIRLERIFQRERFETRRNARVADVGTGKPGKIHLQARLGQMLVSVQISSGVIRMDAASRLRAADGIKLLVIRAAEESPPAGPPTGIDLVVTAGPLVDIPGDPELGCLTMEQIAEIDPRIRNDTRVLERWKDWVRWRRKKKITVTSESARLNLKHLAEAPTTDEMLVWIDFAIHHEWRGLFDPRKHKGYAAYQRGGEATGTGTAVGSAAGASRAEQVADRAEQIRRQFGRG